VPTATTNLKEVYILNFIELLRYVQRSRQARLALVVLLVGTVCFAQDPFVTGLIELAIVVGGMLLAFSGRIMAGVLVALIGGGMLALSAVKWMGWIQSL
jgi:hypothetical protein